MHILVSNDDGYLAEGLKILVEAISDLGKITVVAPRTNRSGASNSLTLSRPLSIQTADNGFMHVDGTPSDCIHIALTSKILEERPGLVVTGINNGANMGEDTIYSGTLAGATEAFLLGISAIAFSLVGHSWAHLESAAKVTRQIIQHHLSMPLSEKVLLNVNIPSCPFKKLQGIRETRLGKRHFPSPAVPCIRTCGELVYWIGKAGPASDKTIGTDFYAVMNSFVSITPLQTDLTDYKKLDRTRSWLELMQYKA